jgi:pimeloyl-ACP methyl ester carboxylesterase
MIGLLILFGYTAALLVAAATAWMLYRLYHPPRRALAFALARHLPADPQALGLAFQNHSFAFADGTSTDAWIISGRASRGPVVVITHGWADTRYQTLTRLGPLPDVASRLVLYDVRGHGESTAPTSRLGVTEADDLLAILDQLGDFDRPLVLMGFSMGAGASIVAAACDPRRRSAAVIAVSSPRFFGPAIAGILRQVQLPVYPFVWLIAGHLAVWLQRPRAYDRAAYAAKLTCPLLVLHGSHDDLVPAAAARQIAAAAPRGQFVEFPGAGHVDLALADPPRYLDVLRRFLSAEVTPQDQTA